MPSQNASAKTNGGIDRYPDHVLRKGELPSIKSVTLFSAPVLVPPRGRSISAGNHGFYQEKRKKFALLPSLGPARSIF